MEIKEIKPTIKDKVMDKWISNYINQLPKDWRKDLDMQLAMKNAMMEALVDVDIYTNNHPLSTKLSDREKEIERLKVLLNASTCNFCNNSGTVHVPEEEDTGGGKETCDNCREKHELMKCEHKNISSSDGLDECLDCGVRNF